MKPGFWLVASLAFVCAAHCANAQIAPVDPATAARVNEFFAKMDYLAINHDDEGMIGLIDPKFVAEIEKLARTNLRTLIQHQFEARPLTAQQTAVKNLERRGDLLAVIIQRTEKWRTGTQAEQTETKHRVAWLSDEGGRLLLRNEMGRLNPDEFDPATRIYTSRKGHYTVTAPPGWLPVNDVPALGTMPDSIMLVGDDGRSRVMLGFVQMPVKIDAKQAVLADSAAEQRLTSEHMLLDQGVIQAGGMEGYRALSEFNAGEEHIKRMRLYLSQPPMLYVFICDAPNAAQFEAKKADFQSLIDSFKVLPTPGGQSVQEVVAAQSAHGAIAGQTYTSQEFNCFIAAPAGWSLHTSANPAHLVEMAAPGGQSMARLIATKGLDANDTAEKAFEQRLGQVRGLVTHFRQTGRREVTIQGVKGIESLQQYTIDGIGDIRLKEVTLVKDGTYYLILCQAIPAAQFAALEPQFDQIIQSFGFIQ